MINHHLLIICRRKSSSTLILNRQIQVVEPPPYFQNLDLHGLRVYYEILPVHLLNKGMWGFPPHIVILYLEQSQGEGGYGPSFSLVLAMCLLLHQPRSYFPLRTSSYI